MESSGKVTTTQGSILGNPVRRVEDPRIRSAAPYQKDLFVNHFRISSIDDEFAGWILLMNTFMTRICA